jgi:hypothetical protein
MLVNGTLTANIFAQIWSFDSKCTALKRAAQGLCSDFFLESFGEILEKLIAGGCMCA